MGLTALDVDEAAVITLSGRRRSKFIFVVMNAEIVAAVGADRFGFKHQVIGLQTFCQQGLTEGVICVAGLFVSDCINCTVS